MGAPARGVFALIMSLAPLHALAIDKADRVLVEKSARTLSLYKGSTLLARMPMVLGGNPVGQKQRAGDGRTPEGSYLLDVKMAGSAFYKSIHISYPDPRDVAAAKQRGVDPGGAIMIHGQRNHLGWAWFLTRHFDWTQGCIALSNRDMDLVWQSVDAGTPIDIKP